MKKNNRTSSRRSSATLPPTYYEFICQLRPLLVEIAERDAGKLLQQSTSRSAIYSADEIDSGLTHFYEKLNAQIMGLGMEHPGLTMEEMESYLASAPLDMKSYLASLYAVVNYEYHVLVNFALAGKKTFHFSNNLSEHLANTEINVKASLIQLPFQCCQFTFTARSIIDAMHNIRGASGRIAMNRLELDYTAPVSVFLTLLPSKNGLPGRVLLINAWHARLPSHSHLMLKRQLYLGEDWTLEQALRTDWEKLSPDDLGIGLSIQVKSGDVQHQDDDLFYTDGLFFFRIVLNAVLYLSSERAEIGDAGNRRQEIKEKAYSVSSISKRRKLLHSMNRHTALEFREVGASVGPIVIRKEDQSIEDGLEGCGGKLQVRFMVRGHWRRQPHGSENQERKLVWIRPYFKGPDIATTINKPYLVTRN